MHYTLRVYQNLYLVRIYSEEPFRLDYLKTFVHH